VQKIVLKWVEHADFEKEMTLAEVREFISEIGGDEPESLEDAIGILEGIRLDNELCEYQDDTFLSCEREVESPEIVTVDS
jgi:hypothetical protein